MRPFPVLPWLLVITLAACEAELSLPSAPVVAPLKVTRVRPTAAFSGTRVRIEGEGLATAADAIVEVRFGGGSAVRALQVLPDEGAVIAEVPDDATSGQVAVTTATGRDESEERFTWRGLGRLRYGRIAAEADLRIPLRAVLALPDDLGSLVLARSYEWAGVVRPARYDDDETDVHTETIAEGVGAVAASGDGEWIFLTFLRGAGECERGSVERRRASEPAKPGTRICLPGTATSPLEGLNGNDASVPLTYANDDGTLAFVIAYQTVWVADFASTPAHAVVSPRGGLTLLYGAALDHSRFVFGQHSELFLVDATDPARPVVSSLVKSPPELSLQAVAAISGKHLVVARCPGFAPVAATCRSPVDLQVFRLDDATSPPRALPGPVRLPTNAPVWALGWSSDGHALAVSQDGARGLVTTFAVEGDTFTPVGSVELEGPRGVSATRDEFVVATLGEVQRLSQRTGERIARVRLPGRLSSPAARIARCGQVGSPRDAPMLELALPTVGAIARLVPNTLQAAEPADGCFWLQRPPGLAVTRLASVQGGSVLFAQGGDTIWKLGPENDQRRATERWAPTGRIGGVFAARTFLPEPGGKALLVATRGGGASDRVTVLPVGATWNEAFAPIAIPAGQTLLDFAADESGRLLVSGRERVSGETVSQVRLYDLAAAIEGRTEPIGEPLVFPQKAVFAAGAVDRLFFVTEVESALRVVQPDGTVSAPASVPAAEVTRAFAVAPGGQRLWFLVSRGGTRRLTSLVFDPVTARVLGEDAPVELPSGSAELYPSADGTLLTVVDPVNDRIVLLE